MVMEATITGRRYRPDFTLQPQRVTNAAVPAISGRCDDASAYAGPVTDHAHATPEAAALSSYSPAAGAHVVGTEVIDDDHVDVLIDFASSHPMRCHCERTIEGWIEAGDIVE